ncbi:condensation domain-containing protein, partial [Flavobacteriaceae bacterium]|nr:condensation domain-containing protein [Flavobacteriaceae bacterium]
AGKLYLSGKGITNGYLNQSELTKEKFIPNRFDIGKTMYETGDLVRWTPNGILEFLGRKDHQVKLRGYRIELAEIEHETLQFSLGIQDAVVAVKIIDNTQVLVGYYTTNENIDKKSLRAHLESKLPTYMIPAYLLQIDSIPLTPNGKLNREVLPNPRLDDVIKKSYVAPKNEEEKQLVEIWEEVLGIQNIGIKDHFFELGGHSLMIAIIINEVSKRMGKTIRFKVFHLHPTIEGISEALQPENFTKIPKVAEAASYPVTSSQNRLWLLSQLDGGTSAYKISGAVTIKGKLDVANFSKAYQQVVKRHDVLRSYFKVNNEGELRQSYIPYADFNREISQKDVSQAIEKEQEIRGIIENELNFQYKLDTAPLIKNVLIRTEANEVIFFISLHHIISDGWSLEVLTSEVIQYYVSLQNNETITAENLPIQYKDYTAWLQKKYTSDHYLNAETYWLQQFKKNVPVLELPSFKKRPAIKTYNGKTLRQVYNKDILTGLKNFSKQQKVTLFMTLMTSVKVLMSRYTNQKDIIVGTPIAGRSHPDLENQIGLYLNTLAIRTRFDEEESFQTLLQKEKQLLLDAFTYQEYPLERLIEQLHLKRDTSRSPLFDVMIALQNHQQLTTVAADFSKLEGEILPYEIENNSAQFDIAFTFKEKDELHLDIQYNTDIYEEEFIQNIAIHLENIFTQ